MHTIEYVLLVYAIVVTVASFLNFIRLDYWWIRIWDFPHLQLTLLAAVGLICWLVFDHTLTGWYSFVPIGLLATLCYQGWLIYPFTPLHRKQVVRVASRTGNDESDASTIRLLVANVLMDNSQTDHVRNLVDKHKPDVLLLLETNQKWQDALAPIAAKFAAWNRRYCATPITKRP
ncbi:MAG: endonuclease, partial [Cytophagaceae bacterium]